MSQLILSEFAPAEFKVQILKRRLDEQNAFIQSLTAELKRVTSPGECCLCGGRRLPNDAEESPTEPSVGVGRKQSRATRARLAQVAARMIDALTDEQLVALIERTFNDREDLRERCLEALREGGRKALVFFRPMLVKALQATGVEGSGTRGEG